jgi:hypothetical protein
MRANCLEPDRLFACTSKMLEGWEEVAVVAHLAACTACREVVEGYRRLDQVLDLWQPTAPLPWFDARVRAAVTAAGQCAPSRRDHLLAGLGWSRWMALALVVIMVVMSAMMIERRPSLRSHSGAQAGGASKASGTNVWSQVAAPETEEEGTTGASTVDEYDMLANFFRLLSGPSCARSFPDGAGCHPIAGSS